MDLPQWLFIPLFRPSITDLQKLVSKILLSKGKDKDEEKASKFYISSSK